MDYVTISGVPPYDGRYELDLAGQPLTTREWGWLKRYANVRPGTLDGNAFTDPETIAVVAIATLRRNRKIDVDDVPTVWERFQDVPFGSTVRWEAGPVDNDEEDDALPPPASSDASSNTNGPSSTSISDRSAAHPSRTGRPPSATSASVPATSAR